MIRAAAHFHFLGICGTAMVVEAIAESGRRRFTSRTWHIMDRLVPLLKAQDVVVIFSNGGFDGIHGKLLARWGEAPLS